MISQSLYDYIDKQEVIEKPVDVPRETIVEEPEEEIIEEEIELLSTEGLDLSVMIPEDVMVNGEIIKIEQPVSELLGQFDSRIKSITEALSEL